MAVFKIVVRKERRLVVEASSLSVLKEALDNEMNIMTALDDTTPDGESVWRESLEFAVIGEQPEGAKAAMFEREGQLYHVDAAVPADPDPKAH